MNRNVTIINLSYKGLTKLPDLSRFENLETLYCSHNELTSLPPLNNTLKVLVCSNNQLTSLPDLNNLRELYCRCNQLTSLPKLNNLIKLDCAYNKLTYLSPLNDELLYLYCNNNQLAVLSPLNNSLKELDCKYNKLTSLPYLNNKLKWLNCFNNPLYFPKTIYQDFQNNIVYLMNITKILKINKWNHFREFYFLSKYRKQIISWMWKSRETKIRQQFHPSHLIRFLENNNVSEDDGETMDTFLTQWN